MKSHLSLEGAIQDFKRTPLAAVGDPRIMLAPLKARAATNIQNPEFRPHSTRCNRVRQNQASPSLTHELLTTSKRRVKNRRL